MKSQSLDFPTEGLSDAERLQFFRQQVLHLNEYYAEKFALMDAELQLFRKQLRAILSVHRSQFDHLRFQFHHDLSALDVFLQMGPLTPPPASPDSELGAKVQLARASEAPLEESC